MTAGSESTVALLGTLDNATRRLLYELSKQ
jgi:hypothetical protein